MLYSPCEDFRKVLDKRRYRIKNFKYMNRRKTIKGVFLSRVKIFVTLTRISGVSLFNVSYNSYIVFTPCPN